MIGTLLLTAMAAFGSQEPIVPVGAKVEQVVTGFGFTEGPIWTRNNSLLFSDIPGDCIIEWKAGKWTTFRRPSNNSNGNQLTPDGNLVTAEHGRRVTMTDMKTGVVKVLAEKYAGTQLNSPNDLVVDKRGIIYFTDPPYGISKKDEKLGFNGVYRITLGGRVEVLARDFRKPNGIGLSPDEKTLYVSDTEGMHVRAFDLTPDGRLLNGRVFFTFEATKPGGPDGLRLDKKGNVYATGPGGVTIISPKGEAIGFIATPEVATNVAWGDADGKTLYITAQKSVYRIKLNAEGLRY